MLVGTELGVVGSADAAPPRPPHRPPPVRRFAGSPHAGSLGSRDAGSLESRAEPRTPERRDAETPRRHDAAVTRQVEEASKDMGRAVSGRGSSAMVLHEALSCPAYQVLPAMSLVVGLMLMGRKELRGLVLGVLLGGVCVYLFAIKGYSNWGLFLYFLGCGLLSRKGSATTVAVIVVGMVLASLVWFICRFPYEIGFFPPYEKTLLSNEWVPLAQLMATIGCPHFVIGLRGKEASTKPPP
jgi:hypothetical protein